MSVNCIGYVYLMPIVALEFSFLLHKHKLNIYLLIYRSLCRYSYKYSAPGEEGKKKKLSTTQQRPLCSIKGPYNTAFYWVEKKNNWEGGKRMDHPWNSSKLKKNIF